MREIIMDVLKDRPELEPVVQAMIKRVDSMKIAKTGVCASFEFSDIEGATPEIMAHLLDKRVARFLDEFDGHAYYCLIDYEGTKTGLKAWNGINEYVKDQSEDSMPDNLFDCIIGYDDAKEVFRMSISSVAAVHILMTSPPASAKSLFLLEMSRLPGAVYVLGHSTSKAGLIDYLITQEPKYLVIDEIDKMSHEDHATLLSLMETGIVGEMKHRRTRSVVIRTKVYAACNNISRLPRELQSRFLKLHFKPYDEDQFHKTVVGVLVSREHVTEELAKYIAAAVWKDVACQDVREAIRLARLCTTKEEVDKVVKALKNYKQDLVYVGG